MIRPCTQMVDDSDDFDEAWQMTLVSRSAGSAESVERKFHTIWLPQNAIPVAQPRAGTAAAS